MLFENIVVLRTYVIWYLIRQLSIHEDEFKLFISTNLSTKWFDAEK